MYHFSNNPYADVARNTPHPMPEACADWAEGAYAVFVAHQFRAWPVVQVTWSQPLRTADTCAENFCTS